MAKILTISRRELYAYFCTPLAYLVLAAFLGMNSYFFWVLIRYLSNPNIPLYIPPMEIFFSGGFTIIFLIIVVPVITMRLLAEEKKSGTIEPMMTAPVTDFEVVMGKFIAALIFYIMLWLPTLAYVLIIKRPEAVSNVFTSFIFPTIIFFPIALLFSGLTLWLTRALFGWKQTEFNSSGEPDTTQDEATESDSGITSKLASGLVATVASVLMVLILRLIGLILDKSGASVTAIDRISEFAHPAWASWLLQIGNYLIPAAIAVCFFVWKDDKITGVGLGMLAFLLIRFIIKYFYSSVGSTPDMGTIISGYFGILLLGIMFISIGMLASAISKDQIVAAIITAAILFIIWLLPLVQQVSPDKLHDFEPYFNYIDINHHLRENFSKGIVDTRPVVYYLSTAVLALFLTVRMVESKKMEG